MLLQWEEVLFELELIGEGLPSIIQLPQTKLFVFIK